MVKLEKQLGVADYNLHIIPFNNHTILTHKNGSCLQGFDFAYQKFNLSDNVLINWSVRKRGKNKEEAYHDEVQTQTPFSREPPSLQ